MCGASALAVFTACMTGQAVAADAVAASDTPTTIGELVVVAEKRETKLETTPVAISAYTAAQRDLIGISTFQDLTDFTPGLSYTSYSNRPYVRGIGRQTDNLAVETGVANYLDGVYNGANASTILQSDTLFIDSIEVLRGPQSTLYGRNADGGAINYISKRPTKDFEAEIRTGVDSYEKYFVEGAVSGPITDWLRFRIGGNYTEQDGGYYKNIDGQPEGGSVAQGGNGKSDHIELQLAGNFGDKVDFWLKVASSDYNVSFHTQTLLGPQDTREFYDALMPNENYGLCDLPGGAGSPGCAPGFAAGPGSGTIDALVPGSVNTLPNTTATNPSSIALRNFDDDFLSKSNENKNISVSTNLVWHGSGFDVKYTFGFQTFAYNLNAPWLDYEGVTSGVQSYQLQGPAAATPTCLAVFASNAAGCTQNLTVNAAQSQFTFDEFEHFSSHELLISSTTNSKLQWLAGLYYYQEYYNQPINVVDASQPQVGAPLELFPLFGGAAVPAPLNPSRSVYNEYTQLNEQSVAAYAQADWQFTPTLKLTGGVRYSNDFKVGYEAFRLVLFNLSPDGVGVGTFGANTPALDATALDCTTTLYPGAGPCAINPTTGQGIRSLEARWDAVTGTVNLAWTPDSDTLVYGKYSRGYKEGGFNSGILAPDPETVPETVDSFELGYKKAINRTFQANIDAFYYLYYNDQQPLGVDSNGVVGSQIVNIPEVHTYGVELETIWQPIRDLTFSLNYAYLSAKVSNGGACVEDVADPGAYAAGANPAGCPSVGGAPSAGGIQLQKISAGSYIAEAPPNKISFNTMYAIRFEPGTLTLSGSVIWKDKEYSSPFNRYYNEAPAYSQVGLRATWTDIKNRYSVIAYADNLFNTTGYDNAYGVPVTNPGPNQIVDKLVSLTAPQTFGVEFQYRFK
jgi:iron complex outermembrane receptor protein